MLIIIKGKQRLGKTRSQLETNLRKEWGTSCLTPEQIDKCSFVERKTGAAWVDAGIVNNATKMNEKAQKRRVK